MAHMIFSYRIRIIIDSPATETDLHFRDKVPGRAPLQVRLAGTESVLPALLCDDFGTESVLPALLCDDLLKYH